jgi:hypothetical protein
MYLLAHIWRGGVRVLGRKYFCLIAINYYG